MALRNGQNVVIFIQNRASGGKLKLKTQTQHSTSHQHKLRSEQSICYNSGINMALEGKKTKKTSTWHLQSIKSKAQKVMKTVKNSVLFKQ